MTNFEAELNAEMTEENIVSECGQCLGTGIVIVTDQFGERPAECECLKKYHNEY